jgi:D-beta-D-heptose 7-phosphate kinase/D-beta-D-heptose 1-phosphate adenosyltransferase
MGKAVLSQLDNLAFRLQRWYMRKKITRERVSRHAAFFHPRDAGKEVLTKYRQSTKTVLVTGCFDILHQEHTKLLVAAKKLGRFLLVGAETDRRVRQLKGPGRPVNNLPVRINNLQKLGIADEVFVLPELTKPADWRTLINQIKPDILAVSSSTPHLAIKRRIMQESGGRVAVVLPHNPKVSTTKLLNSKR